MAGVKQCKRAPGVRDGGSHVEVGNATVGGRRLAAAAEAWV